MSQVMQLMPTRKLDYSPPLPRRETRQREIEIIKGFNGRSRPCEYDIRGSVYSLTSDKERDKFVTYYYSIRDHKLRN